MPFEVPAGDELLERLSSVLEVVYLIFNEGYSATAGDDWMRPALCNEAMRLGRLLAELMPDEPEVHGLLALMELQASRANARIGPEGEPVLLLDQDRRRWDRLLIRRGLAGLDRAWALDEPPGPYLPAGRDRRLPRPRRRRRGHRLGPHRRPVRDPRAGHAVTGRRAEPGGRDLAWRSARSAAWKLVDALADDPSLKDYHLLPSVRGDLLFKLGRLDEAREEFEKAAALTRNERERTLLLERAAAC